MMVTETWLSKNISDSAIKIGNNYEIFRLDRDTLGGGILAYISSYIRVERITHLEETGEEVLWLVLKPPRTPRKPYQRPLEGKINQIATNMFNPFDSASHLPGPFGRSDHQCILLKPKNNLKIPPTTKESD
jgi:hypothetical protein